MNGRLLSDRLELGALTWLRKVLPLVTFWLLLLYALIVISKHLGAIFVNVHLFVAGSIHGRAVTLTHQIVLMHDGSVVFVVPTIVLVHYYN